MRDEWKTPKDPSWLSRIYGDTISPREVILTIAVVGLVLALMGVI